MNDPNYFEIHAGQPQRTIEIYRKIFGWWFVTGQGLPVEYWTIRTGEIFGGLFKRPAEPPPPECRTNAFVNLIQDYNSFHKYP